jgi:uncharacterized protein YqgC (DUF456 family)
VADLFQQTGWWLVHGVAILLCFSGIFISLLSITGGWLVTATAALLTWYRPDSQPGWTFVIILLVACVLVEVADAVAGSLGISRRGGSAKAGWAALFGGLIGMVLGGFIPVPVLGSLIGMCAGSFAFAFWVERSRLQHDARAAHIAWGAVWARLGVMVIKTVTALGMTVALWYDVLAR